MDDNTRDLLRRVSELQPTLDEIRSLPSGEVLATDRVRGAIAELANISAALLQNAKQQQRSAERATRAIIRLTVALVVLTVVLVVLTYLLLADVLRWWPVV